MDSKKGSMSITLSANSSRHFAETRDTYEKFRDLNYQKTLKKLLWYYRTVKRQILLYQSPTTGMFPHDLSEPNCVVSHVRDSIYCAAAVWALSQSFKRIDDDKGKTLELAQSAVKCMRGILACWMRQADKVEKFKQNQSAKNALHSKFHLVTGDTVTRDEEYEHLQIDCVALYLIFLVQMITSGLQIIFTTDEVNFVQNLVFYVERAYRTTDFGMWERGSKYNNGSSELHASSIGLAKAALEGLNGANMFGDTGAHCSVGMAKAALESIGGENMFGLVGSYWSTIYVGVDTHQRNWTTFNTLLPRESASKNTDASLLPTVSWPAFAIHEETLVHHTLGKITRKLKGPYGFKRFLRDGCFTVLEDRSRKYYRPEEIKTFDGIECQWPVFVIHFLIDSIFRQDKERTNYYQSMIKTLVKPNKDALPIVPKYYYVPKECIEAERANPGSQKRIASSEGEHGNMFLWGQSVYIISQLLVEGLLNVNELDPIRRHLPAAERPRPNSRYSSFQRGSSVQSSPSDLVIQVALISESVRLQQMLSTYGIQTQTPHQVDPIQIWPPCELAKAYEQLGVNQKLGLSGRPPRPVGGLGTGKIYRACGSTVICYPLLFETSDFYLCQDMRLVLDDVKIFRFARKTFLCHEILFDVGDFYKGYDIVNIIEDVKTDLTFLSKCWKLSGRPTFCMIIREDNIRGPNARYIFQLLAQFKRGECDGIKVRLGRLQEFISSACIEHLDFLTNRCAEQMFFHPFVEKDILTRQFRSLTFIAAPVAKGTEAENWVDPKILVDLSNFDLEQKSYESVDSYEQMQILQTLLNREGLYYRFNELTIEERLENLCRTAGNHQLWAVVRFGSSLLGKVVDSLAPSITSILVRGKHVTIGVFGHDEEVIEKPISPQGIKHILYQKCFTHDVIQAVLQQELLLNIGRFITTNPKLFDGILKIRIGWVVQALKLELTNCKGQDTSLNVMSPSAIKRLLLQVLSCTYSEISHRSVLWSRQLDGALNRVPPDFYDRVWHILERTAGGLKVAGYHLPQQPTLSDMTEYELNFSLLVEQMLSKIIDPTYRQIIVESFMVVDVILTRNTEVSFSKVVDMDKLVYEALQLFHTDRQRDGRGCEDLEDEMNAFYNTAPNVQCGTTSYIAKAVVNSLLDGHLSSSAASKTTCHLS